MAFEGRTRVDLLFNKAVDSELQWKETGVVKREVEDSCMMEQKDQVWIVEAAFHYYF